MRDNAPHVIREVLVVGQALEPWHTVYELIMLVCLSVIILVYQYIMKSSMISL